MLGTGTTTTAMDVAVPPLERFSQAIATLLLYLREGGGGGGGGENNVAFLEGILPQLQTIGRAAADAMAISSAVRASVRELHLHALDQVVQTTYQSWSQSLLQKQPLEKHHGGGGGGEEAGDEDEDEDDEESRQFERQRALARSTELILIFIRITMDICQSSSSSSSSTDDDKVNNDDKVKTLRNLETTMIDAYAQGQRTLLRHHCKPAIARLVGLRRNGAFAATALLEQPQPAMMTMTTTTTSTALSIDKEESTLQQPPPPEQQQLHHPHHHADALADILQHAANLLHPLLAWRASGPAPDSLVRLCDTSIAVLRQQAVDLIVPPANWFYQDRDISGWQKKQAANAKSLLNGGYDGGENNDKAGHLLSLLPQMDAVVAELADMCRMLQDFCHSVFPVTDEVAEAVAAPLQRLIAEWTVHYGSLESYLVLQQYSSCVPQAVVTVVDSDIRVPSMVEDAHLLTMNALHRAPSLQTIAYALAHDLWSTDCDVGHHNNDNNMLSRRTTTVFGALQRRDGCQVLASLSAPAAAPPGNTKTTTAVAPQSGNNFADALALAIDEDPTTHAMLDEHFCYWNGMHAASAAVRSFAEALLCEDDDAYDDEPRNHGRPDDNNNGGSHSSSSKGAAAAAPPLPKSSSSMLSIVRDDLERFAQTYESTMDLHLAAVIDTLDVWDDLRRFFQQETYNVTSSTAMAAAEAEDRLDAGIAAHLRSSRFIQQIPLKAEALVQPIVWNKLARHATDLLLHILCDTKPAFTEWGALLFAKQVRVLQASIPALDTTSAKGWGGLAETVALLQLEQPSDWTIYRVDCLKRLRTEQVATILSLRVDFSKEAVANVVGQQRN